MTTDFEARLASLRADHAPTPPAPAPAPAAAAFDPNLGDGVKPELKRLALLPIYRAWFNPVAERGGTGNEVNLSCFNSDFHASGDKHPQFGINTATNLYHCHACNVSGDIIDLAAVRWGLASGPDWKCPDDRVHEAVKFAGEELLGYSFQQTPGGWQKVPEWRGVTQPAPQTHAIAPVHPQAQVNYPGIPDSSSGFVGVPEIGVATGFAGPPMPPMTPPSLPGPPAWKPPVLSEEDVEEARLWNAEFALDWRSFVPTGTPLRSYMELVTIDDTPEEFHFWNFMSLIGLVMGKKVFTPDTKRVYGNLLTCIIGRSGQGKSRAEEFIHDLISESAPFDREDQYTTGIKVIKNPGSGEYLASEFCHEVPDPMAPPNTPPKHVQMLRNPSVKALVRWPEMATMIGKSQGKGSIIQQTVIELYDVPRHIGGGSMTNGAYGADNPFGSVATTTQLKALRKLVSSDDASSGFLNRWLFIIGQSKARQPRGKIIDIDPIVPQVRRLQEWVERMNRERFGALDLDDRPGGSGELYDSIILSKVIPLEEDPSEMLSRAVLTFKKLVLLFSANMMETVISREAIAQAEIAFNYLMDCLRHIGVRLQRNEFEEIEVAIVEAISVGEGEGRTGRDIRRALKPKNPEWTTDVVNRALKVLEEAGRIELATIPQPGGKVGRPMKRYFVIDE